MIKHLFLRKNGGGKEKDRQGKISFHNLGLVMPNKDKGKFEHGFGKIDGLHSKAFTTFVKI